MISVIRARVSSRTNGDSLMTRETVFFETFARRAISLMVCLRSSSVTKAGGGGCARGSAGAFAGRPAIFVKGFLGMSGEDCNANHDGAEDNLTPVSPRR